MYAFLRKPIWILSHVLIAALVITLVALGFWQRARWMEERDKFDALAEKATLPAVPYDEALDPASGTGEVSEDLRFVKVSVTGVYDIDSEIAILNRSQEGRPGAWVLTPLVQSDGTAVAVIRGWIPYDPAGVPRPFVGAEPPQGEVTVVGNLQLTQERGSFGQVDPDDGVVESLARVDLDRFEQQLDVPLGPAWVLLDEQSPPQTSPLPEHVDLLTDDPSQNFSYMVQWWIFAAIAALGYPLVLRMVARNRQRNDQVPVDDEFDPTVPGATGPSGPGAGAETSALGHG